MGVTVETAKGKPLAKSKVRVAHVIGISEWQEWCSNNPESPRDEKVIMFNYFIDKAAKKNAA